MLSIEEWKKAELRVGEIKGCERVEDSNKLYKLTVSLGSKEITLVAGIAEHYDCSELIGKQIVVVVNLKPAVIRGVKSEGMLLCAVDDKSCVLITPERKVECGAEVM